jgi:hypothetical protein
MCLPHNWCSSRVQCCLLSSGRCQLGSPHMYDWLPGREPRSICPCCTVSRSSHPRCLHTFQTHNPDKTLRSSRQMLWNTCPRCTSHSHLLMCCQSSMKMCLQDTHDRLANLPHPCCLGTSQLDTSCRQVRPNLLNMSQPRNYGRLHFLCHP